MARSSDDDVSSRLQAAGWRLLFDTRNEVQEAEVLLARRVVINRFQCISVTVAVIAILTAAGGTVLAWETSRFLSRFPRLR